MRPTRRSWCAPAAFPAGDFNWQEALGKLEFSSGRWGDAWEQLNPPGRPGSEPGWTYDVNRSVSLHTTDAWAHTLRGSLALPLA